MKNVRDPKAEGRNAYCDDVARDKNSYKKGTAEFKLWDQAWLDTELNDPLRPDID